LQTVLRQDFRLFVDEGMTAVVVALEIGRRSFAAEVAVDTLFVDVKFPRGVFRYLFAGSAMFRFE